MRALPTHPASGMPVARRHNKVDEAACVAGWTISGVAVLVAIVTAWIIGI